MLMDLLRYILTLVKRWFTSRQDFENNFHQLLFEKRYDEAMQLAQQNEYLDIDLVYKCRWRSGGITVQSINSVLSKIQDKLWAINECVRTVPISHEACRTLIEFGLRQANLKLLYQLGEEESDQRATERKNKQTFQDSDDLSDAEYEGLVDFDYLNDQQKELCRCRQDLLRYEHSLFAYESILGDYRAIQQHFNHVFYDEFRQKCPLEACIDFAHEGDGHAVETLLNFYTDDLSPHLLAILSNFPETLSPYQYRNLLPCLHNQLDQDDDSDGERNDKLNSNDNHDEVFQWRPISGRIKMNHICQDWSDRGCGGEHGNSSSFMISMKYISEEYEKEFYEDCDNLRLKKYLKPHIGSLLTEWYIERALEMESRTLLLLNAIQLLHLGTELNIRNLKPTHDDLIEFDRVVFDCCTESNIYLSFTEFNQMPLVDCLVLMTGESIKFCKEGFRFYVIPYMHRREAKLGKEGKAKILKEYFICLAKTRGQIGSIVYKDLLDKIETDTFVSDWTQGLESVLNEIGYEIEKIDHQTYMADRKLKHEQQEKQHQQQQRLLKQQASSPSAGIIQSLSTSSLQTTSKAIWSSIMAPDK